MSGERQEVEDRSPDRGKTKDGGRPVPRVGVTSRDTSTTGKDRAPSQDMKAREPVREEQKSSKKTDHQIGRRQKKIAGHTPGQCHPR